MGTSATRPFDDDYLLAYSEEHVVYEVKMFLALVAVREATISSVSGGLIVLLKNAVIEATVLHLRNLIEFLYNDDPRPSDVVAGDFFTTPSWDTIRPEISEHLESSRRRANKEMAHLTTGRRPSEDKAKRWDILRLREELMPVLRLFVDRADPDKLAPGVAPMLEK